MNSIAFAQKEQSVSKKTAQTTDIADAISAFKHPLQMISSQSPSSQSTLNDTQRKYRDAMSGLASAVNIITTDGEAGQAGFTASAVCSVTDTPPTLLVCLNRNASVYTVFKDNQVLSVNTLAQQHTNLSQLFGGKTPMPERFKQGDWQTLVTGCPILNDAVVSFDCKVSQTISVGTHDIFFCEVLDIQQQQDAQGLVYFDRAYHQLHKHQ